MTLADIALAGAYNPLYLAAFAVAFGLAWREGRRRGLPAAEWLVLLAAVAAGGIVGSRLAIPLTAVHAAPGAKTILGGLLGGTVGFAAARRLLRLDGATPDALLPALPIGMALGRVGCYLAGCCFGGPTSLPWAVRYGAGTEAHAAQRAAGLIPTEAAVTLGIHPVQLYEAGLVVLLALAVGRGRGRLRRPGSAFLGFLAGYGVIRSLLEFVRFDAPGAATVDPAQWAAGCAAIVLAAVVVRRERTTAVSTQRPGREAVRKPASGTAARSSRARRVATGAPGARMRSAGVVALCAAPLLLAPGWLTPLEHVALAGALLPALAVVLRGAHRLAAGAAPALALLLVQAPQDAPGPAPGSAAGSDERGRYITVGGGVMTGGYQETCGGARRYTVGGVSAGIVDRRGRHERATARGRLFLGADRPKRPRRAPPSPGDGAAPETDGAPPDDRLGIAGLAAMAAYDWHYFGAGVGFAAGSLVLDGEHGWPIFPSVALRVGSRSGFFVEGRFADHDPAPFPGALVKLGIGLGGDGRDSPLFRLGVSEAGFYSSGEFVLGGGYELLPFASYGDTDTYQLGLTVRRRVTLRPAARDTAAGLRPPPPSPGRAEPRR